MNGVAERREHDARVLADFAAMLLAVHQAVTEGHIPAWFIESLAASPAWDAVCRVTRATLEVHR